MQDLSHGDSSSVFVSGVQKPFEEALKLQAGALVNPNTEGPQGASLFGVTVPAPEAPAGALLDPNTDGPQIEAFNDMLKASAPEVGNEGLVVLGYTVLCDNYSSSRVQACS